MTARSLVLLAAACASLSGCALLSRPSRPDPPPSPVARAQTTHELATPRPRQTVASPGAVNVSVTVNAGNAGGGIKA